MTRSGAQAVRWVLALLVLTLGLGTGPGRASDEVYAALVQRGFEPWPQAFLTEIPFVVGAAGEGVLDTGGYKIRLPRPTQAKWVLVAVPDRVVIVDVVAGTGPVALSQKALDGLGLGRGGAAQKMQILALRRLGSAPEQPGAPATARAPKEAPLPPDRPRVASASPVETVPTFSNPAPPTGEPQPVGGPAPSGDTDVTRIRIGQDVAPLLNAAASAGKLALQAGYFSTPENAGDFAEKIEALGLPSVIQRTTTLDGTPRWRVLAGPFADDAARQKAKTLGGDVLRDAYSVVLE